MSIPSEWNCRTRGQRIAAWMYESAPPIALGALIVLGAVIECLRIWSVETRLP